MTGQETLQEVYKDKFNDELEKQLNIKQLVLDALINERCFL